MFFLYIVFNYFYTKIIKKRLLATIDAIEMRQWNLVSEFNMLNDIIERDIVLEGIDISDIDEIQNHIDSISTELEALSNTITYKNIYIPTETFYNEQKTADMLVSHLSANVENWVDTFVKEFDLSIRSWLEHHKKELDTLKTDNKKLIQHKFGQLEQGYLDLSNMRSKIYEDSINTVLVQV